MCVCIRICTCMYVYIRILGYMNKEEYTRTCFKHLDVAYHK